MSIPIIIGVTGHRDLNKADIPQLQALVTNELSKLKAAYPHSPLIMLNSLASGADTLCAKLAIEQGIELKCPLPMPLPQYRQDFSGEDLIQFDKLIVQASEVFVCPLAETLPKIDNRDFYYRQAGIYLATHCHVLLALWDGLPAKPNGCGTAEVVEFMLKGYSGLDEVFHAGNDGAVIHVLTPRKGASRPDYLSARLLEHTPNCLSETLGITEAFNSDALAIKDEQTENELLPNVGITDELLRRLESLHTLADKLSLRFQKQYLLAIRLFSLFGMLLVLFFLLYDELESDAFLFGYGAVFLLYTIAFLQIRKSRCHFKYLQYRTLAETIRAQFYLSASGSHTNIGTAFTWTQKQESTWIKRAISALLIGPSVEQQISTDAIKTAWIDKQLAYHQKAFRLDRRRHRFNQRSTTVMLVISAVLYASVLVIEFFYKDAMTHQLITKLPVFLLPHIGQTFTLRGLMKIILGGISAFTVFLSNYYGKLSFERKSSDHEKMANLYAQALVNYENKTLSPQLLFYNLAREEIIENGNWFSYCQENPPSFNL